jgi:uncharacterized protein YhhL (DUF1145 family)
MMITFSKIGCLAIYTLAITALAGWPNGNLATVTQVMALLLLATHLLEALLMRKRLKRLPGSLTSHVALTLLFGLLHWKPLLDQQARVSKPP